MGRGGFGAGSTPLAGVYKMEYFIYIAGIIIPAFKIFRVQKDVPHKKCPDVVLF